MFRKSKKGFMPLYILLELAIAVVLSLSLLYIMQIWSNDLTVSAVYASREMGSTVSSIVAIPTNLEVNYKVPYLDSNLATSYSNDNLVISQWNFNGTTQKLPLAKYYLSFPKYMVVNYPAKEISLNNYKIKKTNIFLDLSGDASQNIVTSDDLTLNMFKEGKFLYFESEDISLQDVKTSFNQIIDKKCLIDKNSEKIFVLIKLSSEEKTKIHYSQKNEHYLKPIAEAINQKLSSFKSNSQPIFNLYPATFEKGYDYDLGENLILIEVQSDFSSSSKNNDKQLLGQVLAQIMNDLISS